MKWHEYKTLYQRYRASRLTDLAEREWLAKLRKVLTFGKCEPELYNLCWASSKWNALRRPYYNVYPSLQESLSRTTLDVSCKAISDGLAQLPRYLSVRYQVGHELETGTRRNIPDFFYFMNTAATRETHAPVTAITIHVRRQDLPATSIEPDGREIPLNQYMTYTVGLRQDENLEHCVVRLWAMQGVFPNDIHKMHMAALRTISCLALLQSDPEIISPVVLNAHREKFEATGDPKYIEKAAKRGVVGWEVGRDIEVGPHYRRPHFGIRWTGKGAKEPKLVPVKGSIVHRKKVGEVPTGYLGQYA